MEMRKTSILVICVSQALKMITPSFSLIDVEGSESTLSCRVNKYIERYIRLVLEYPSNVGTVAVKLLNEEEAMYF